VNNQYENSWTTKTTKSENKILEKALLLNSTFPQMFTCVCGWTLERVRIHLLKETTKTKTKIICEIPVIYNYAACYIRELSTRSLETLNRRLTVDTLLTQIQIQPSKPVKYLWGETLLDLVNSFQYNSQVPYLM